MIKEKDRLSTHPYESFDIVNQFVKSAATDPNVVSIKQTIYRADKKSKLIQSLMEASINGIDVNVVIELQARFDEEANLKWAEKLENVGAHVVHGKPNFKCHAKLLIISRKEINPNNNKPYIQHYAHLGTGNYSAGNAKSYTDFGLFTADKTICNAMPVPGSVHVWHKISVPYPCHTLRRKSLPTGKIIKIDTGPSSPRWHGDRISAPSPCPPS